MTGRATRRRQWAAAAIVGLSAAGMAVAQVSSGGLPPDPTSLVPIVVPLPPEAHVPPVTAPLPPLVVTPPAARPAPPKPVIAREVAPLPSVVKPELPVAVAPPIPEPPKIVVPKIETPPVVLVPSAPPVVPAATASVVKPAKPAIAEIIASGPKVQDASAAFAKSLADAKAAYAKVRDYSGHMIMQERVKGELQPEQTAELRIKAQPRSIAVKFIAPSALVGRELIFAEGRNGNKARVKAAGTYGPLAFAGLAVSDPKAAVTARHTLADVGLAAVLERVDRALAVEAKLRNPVTVTAADYTFAGKTVTRFEILCERPHALRDAARLVVCIDPDTKLPVRLEVHDGASDGSLREAVSFVNLTFNQGMGDGPFEK